jgi:hypothetical protein
MGHLGKFIKTLTSIMINKKEHLNETIQQKQMESTHEL